MSLSSSGAGFTTTPSVVSYGMVSGINTQQIIQAELQPWQYPITNLQNEQSANNGYMSDYQQINTDLVSLQGSASLLAMNSGWNARSATSSDSSVASATAADGTPTGSVQFNVVQLAAADSLVSSGSVSSTSQIVTSASSMLLSEGADQLGFSTLASGSGVSLGNHTISVTQSSQAASLTGTTSLGSQTSGINIGTGNDTLSVTANGTTYNLTLASSASGGYSGSQLLSALQSAISAKGASGVIQAGYDSSGHLIVSTVNQGSSQTLQINSSSSALTTLGLSTGTSTGVDAVVNLDGTANTFSTVTAGTPLTLNGPAGETVTATVEASSAQTTVNSSLIQAGSVTADAISTGSGSLSDVVNAINSSGTGIVASAVQASSGQYVLQMSSSTTGTNGDLSVDPNIFSTSALGAMKTAVAGQNAEIQIGGASGYTISSQNNTFTGLLPGLTVNVSQVSTNPVTVTVGKDASAIANSVQQMVDDANRVLGDVQQFAGYNEATKKGGPLMGSAVLQNLTNQVLGAFASGVGISNLGSAASIGIKIDNGQISFDKTAFENAFNSNSAQVQNLFTQGGTFSAASSAYTGQVQFSYASKTTQPGSYDVNVSHSATQASSTGATLASGSVSAAETLTVDMGSASATFATSAGQSLTAIANGLNSAFAAQGMGLTAQVVNGTQLQLVSSNYGSATSFTVKTTNTASGTLGLAGGAASATYTGTDVAGTINGVAATGNGQYLTAPTTDPTLGGLSVLVTASGITSATDLGSVTYTPGLAQGLSNITAQYGDPSTGSITQAIKGLQDQNININPQISMYQNMLNQEQKLLMAKYATMEATLGGLKNQASALAGQLAQIKANGG